jgi:hypothetical protein
MKARQISNQDRGQSIRVPTALGPSLYLGSNQVYPNWKRELIGICAPIGP